MTEKDLEKWLYDASGPHVQLKPITVARVLAREVVALHKRLKKAEDEVATLMRERRIRGNGLSGIRG